MFLQSFFLASVLMLHAYAQSSLAPAGCAPLPANLNLPIDPKLPDPFTFFGTDVRAETKEQWTCRRDEISQLFQRFELGTLPGPPEVLNATLSSTGTTLTITAGHAGNFITFTVTISLPKTGTAPFPAIIGIGGSSIPQPAGVASITLNNNDIALQNDATSRGVGKFYQLYGTNATASSMIAWAWATSRIIDVLEGMPQSKIDLSRLGVTGCSRNGKGALVAGAFEPRIALTIVQESGSGGAGCWRISDAMLAGGIVTQTASEIVQENVWFSTEFDAFASTGNVTALPFDHHMLAGLVAPRGLLIIDNTGIDWLGPESVFGCMKTGNKIFQALGVADHMGVTQVSHGSSHCSMPASEQPNLNAFVNKFFFGQPTNTSWIETDGANNLGFVDSDWVDWSVPQLL